MARSVVTPERFASGMTFEEYLLYIGSPENLAREGFGYHGGSSSGTAVDIRGPSSMKHRASSRVRPIPSTSACALYLRARVTTSTAHRC